MKSGAGNFQCHKYAHGLHKESSAISELKAVDAVLKIIKQVIDSQQIQFDYISPAASSDSNSLDKYKSELKKLDVKEKRIKAAYEDGIDTLEEYKENKTRLQNERATIELKITNLSHEEPDKDIDMKPIIIDRCRSVYEILLSDVDNETKATALRSVCSKIVFDKKNYDFKMHFYTVKP